VFECGNKDKLCFIADDILNVILSTYVAFISQQSRTLSLTNEQIEHVGQLYKHEVVCSLASETAFDVRHLVRRSLKTTTSL
jgi:hypothetical protein